MKSTKIEELKRRRQAEIKPRKSQLLHLSIVIFLSIIVCCSFLNINRTYSIIWTIGILMGITMQRARFCFAASFRDPIILGTTSLFRAIIIGIVICTVGFSIFQYSVIGDLPNYNIDDIPGQIYPVGLHTIIGSILFGIGMVIAGSCTSGMLIRIGEGHLLQIVVLIGFIIGAVSGASHFKFWDRLSIASSKSVYIPQYIGFLPAVITQLAVLGILYFLAGWYDKNNKFMKL